MLLHNSPDSWKRQWFFLPKQRALVGKFFRGGCHAGCCSGWCPRRRGHVWRQVLFGSIWGAFQGLAVQGGWSGVGGKFGGRSCPGGHSGCWSGVQARVLCRVLFTALVASAEAGAVGALCRVLSGVLCRCAVQVKETRCFSDLFVCACSVWGLCRPNFS